MTPELIVALDLPSSVGIETTIATLPGQVLFYKVGLELFIADGQAALRTLVAHDKRVFLDLKLHDIPNTVARAVRAVARLGVSLLTVHAGGGKAMLRAAAEAACDAGAAAPRLLAVTTLTSLDEDDLREVGVARPLRDHTLALGEMAIAAGVDGLICSVHEAAELRRRLGPQPVLVTPGIRPAGSPAADQKRVASPGDAVRAGANFLVIGRPILDDSNPRRAAESVLRDIAEATAARNADR